MEPLFHKRKQQLNLFRKRRFQDVKKDPKEVPENVMMQCLGCKESVIYEDLMKHHYVCMNCNYHFKISARERIRELCDPKSFKELFKGMKLKEEPTFPGYSQKLSLHQQSFGMEEALICGMGKIQGEKAVIVVMDSHFMMGSMGSVVGEKITRSIEFATKKKLPLIIFSASGGARMQEGILSLVQMAKTSAALGAHKEAGLLYISYLTNPTTGGVSASFAMLGDIQIAEPNALIGFAGKRVIESTIKEKLPEDFQTAEFLLEHGFLDMIVERKDMRKTIGTLLDLHKGGHSWT